MYVFYLNRRPEASVTTACLELYLEQLESSFSSNVHVFTSLFTASTVADGLIDDVC